MKLVGHVNRLWKATDFRQFLCYSGIYVLKDNLEENVYYHYLLLCCAPDHLYKGEKKSMVALTELIF